jgi:hypothetical protein
MRIPGQAADDMIDGARLMSRSKRISVLLFAAAQLALPAALTVADGYLEIRAPENAVFAHIEAHGTPRCPRVHQEDTCAIFHFLSRTGAVKPEAPPAPRVVEKIASFVSSEVRVAAGRAILDPTLPRAPPTA